MRLLKWLESEYCTKRNINMRTVSPVIRKWLKGAKADEATGEEKEYNPKLFE
jgi:hypothetical protein